MKSDEFKSWLLFEDLSLEVVILGESYRKKTEPQAKL